MRSFSHFVCSSAALFLACAPTEAPRTASPEQPKTPASAPSPIIEAQSPETVSTLPPTSTPEDDSLPFEDLRDSLSVPGNPEPGVPMTFPNICPGEGCRYGTWIACKPITALSEARAGAPVAFTLHRGDTLVSLTGNQVVERAGKVVFRDTVRVRTAELARYLFTPADTLYPLSYDGEGLGTWYFHGRVGGGTWFFNENNARGQPDPGIVVARERITRWWVQARNRDGKEGWFESRSGMVWDPRSHYADGCPIS